MIFSLPLMRRSLNILFKSRVDFIWFDFQPNIALESLLSPYEVLRLDIRRYVYITPFSLLLSVFLFPRFGKLSIYVSLIYLLAPKALLTCIHNNHTFWELSSKLTKYKFLILQNSYQPYLSSSSSKPDIFGFVAGLDYKYPSSLSFYSFSHIASIPFIKAGAPSDCFKPIGSLKLSYALNMYSSVVPNNNSLCLIADGTCSYHYFITLLEFLSNYIYSNPLTISTSLSSKALHPLITSNLLI